jgi:signal transduction histidine kinase
MRIGAELHDGLGQQLTAIELMCQSLKEDLGSKQPRLEKQVAQLGGFLREAIAQTRSLSRGLSPVNLNSDGLAEALSELARRTTEYGGVKCALVCPRPVLIKDVTVTLHLFRIAQEAVNNAVKHAGAKKVTIGLSEKNEAVCLAVSDDGRGLPRLNQPGQGIGLQVMKHRAGLIGAELNIESKPGRGVRINCVFRRGEP